MRTLIGLSLLCLAGSAFAQAGSGCEMPVVAAAGGVPLAPELAAPDSRLGAPSGVLSQAVDQALTVDDVLLRVRAAACMLAKATPALDANGYQPKTQFDNTPWRFDMNQNGRRMTADEFSAWMKAKGVRVARGAAPAAAAPEAAPTAEAGSAVSAGQSGDGEKR